MKKIVFLLLGILTFMFSYSQETGSVQTAKIPSVEIKDLSGKPFNTSEILNNDGNPVIIDFWATWCKPCIKELMAIDEVYPDWQDETGVVIYAVSIDDTRSMNRVAPFVNGKGWEYKVLLDPNGDFKRAMGVVDIPHTFVLDGEGNIVLQHTAYNEGDEEEIYNKLIEITQNKEK